MIDSVDNQCMNCLRCVQGCRKELIQKSINPEYAALGDSHWTPDIISRLWYQAETGKIPVSGAGYPGPFAGGGFDGMWTDMSEIVRPTRDGIHGREYISTAVDLGKKPNHLTFDERGNLLQDFPSFLEIPLPIIMRMPSFGSVSGETVKGLAMAARRLGTFLALSDDRIDESLSKFLPSVIPVIGDRAKKVGENTPLVEIPWKDDPGERRSMIEAVAPSSLVSVRLPLTERADKQSLELVKSGLHIIHLSADDKGRMMDDENRFVRDAIRSVHRELLEHGIRDEATLLVSGGIAMAEHVAKAIICGADGVVIDFPILIALECRMCRRCTKGLSCPVEIEKAPSDWVAKRVVNLFGAWHNQLLEMMGAMGIRDARRLRGETGRAMFFEDLDRAVFGSMGKFEEGYELE